MLITIRRCNKNRIEAVILVLYKILICSYCDYFMQLCSLHFHKGKKGVEKIYSIKMREIIELKEVRLKRLHVCFWGGKDRDWLWTEPRRWSIRWREHCYSLIRGQEEGDISLKEEEIILKQIIIKPVINFRNLLPQKVTEVNCIHKSTKQWNKL